MSDTPEHIARTPENIEKITQQLFNEGFSREIPQQRELFESILNGRLEGYTKNNCPHPDDVGDAHSRICTQCGYEEYL